MWRILILTLSAVTVFVTLGCGGVKRTKAKFNKKLQVQSRQEVEDSPFGKASEAKKCLQLPMFFDALKASGTETAAVYTVDLQLGTLRNMGDKDNTPTFDASGASNVRSRFLLKGPYAPFLTGFSGAKIESVASIEPMNVQSLDAECEVLTLKINDKDIPFEIIDKSSTTLRAKNISLGMLVDYRARTGKLFMHVFKPNQSASFEGAELPSHIHEIFVVAHDQGLRSAVMSHVLGDTIQSCFGDKAPPELKGGFDEDSKSYLSLSYTALDSIFTLIDETKSDTLLCK
jgi:hypothetical protein